MRTTFLLILVIPFLTACGVTERRQLMTDRDPEQVWAAMRAVAETPDYYMQSADVTQRWVVRENEVWVDESARRMEVYRRLERELHQPLAPVQHDMREWKFEIALEEPASPAQPVMLFRTRNSGVPAHAWEEAAMYFDEVERFLGPMAPAATAPAK